MTGGFDKQVVATTKSPSFVVGIYVVVGFTVQGMKWDDRFDYYITYNCGVLPETVENQALIVHLRRAAIFVVFFRKPSAGMFRSTCDDVISIMTLMLINICEHGRTR